MNEEAEMNGGERLKESVYMRWAKTKSQARFNLASSGLMNFPLASLPVSLADIELSGPSFYGYEPLQQAIAVRCDVSPDCVVATTGTSMANHLAMAATLELGDEVLIEQPGYELLVAVARYLGAQVKRFERSFEENFCLDLREIERSVTSRTRLIVITNLHNPSSALIDDEMLKRAGELARECGARVLVDEVYLAAAFERAPRSAFHLGEEFITTNSLTKVYGLSGLRCGWVLAEPQLAEKMWRLNDLFGVIPAHSAERLSCIAFAHLDEIGQRARQLLDTNSAALNRFIASRDDIKMTKMEFGTTAFPRLESGKVEELCELLRQKYETSIVPGRFFESSQHFRIGIGCDTTMLKEGLERIGLALNELVEIT